MCKLNPKQEMTFKLEVYTSDPNITREEFEKQVCERVMKAELVLNADGKFRFHIWEV